MATMSATGTDYPVRIRSVSGGSTATVAGAADGNLAAATFDSPYGLAYYNEQLFVADYDGQTIRRIR